MADIFSEVGTVRDGVSSCKLFIGGSWSEAESGEYMDVHNPANGSVVSRVPRATTNDIKRALDSAYEARGVIAAMPAMERAKVLLKAGHLITENAKTLATRIMLESGKPIKDAMSEVNAAAERLEYAAEEAKAIKGEVIRGDIAPGGSKRIGLVMRKPLGLIIGITPFNYPIFIPMAKIAPALAAGNSLVIKPASADPSVMYYVAEIFKQAGLPAGVLNIVTGSGEAIGDALVSDPRVGMVSFTGSTAVGQRVSEKVLLAKLHLELGGKGAGIVLKDADLDLAAKESVKGSFKLSGQRCDALGRILVVPDVLMTFTDKVVAEAKTWVMGDPTSESTVMGPLVNDQALKKVQDLVSDAVSRGAKVLLGGNVRQGLYFEPTVLTNVTTEMRIAWEETFGPVVTIMPVKDYEDAVAITNKSNYGLDSSIFTSNIDLALDAGQRIECGTVQINASPAHGLGQFAFGGDKDSGVGREGFGVSVEDMSRLHTIVFNPR